MNRIRGISVGIAAAVRFTASGAVLLLPAISGCRTAPERPPDERIMVEAAWESPGSRELPRCMIRQLVAWRGGEVRVSTRGMILLQVRRIVKGRLANPGILQKNQGMGLDVIPLDTVAAAVDSEAFNHSRVVEGLWTLTRLPDGSYAASDLSATPITETHASAELETTARMTAGLASDDPQIRYNALRLFRERCCFAMLPLVICMLGSDERVTVPDWHWDSSRGARPGPSTLGREATAALAKVAARIDRPIGRMLQDCFYHPGNETLSNITRSVSHTGKTGAEAWREWWDGVLRTEPFPCLVSATVRSREIITLPVHGGWPYLWVSPDGRFAVLSATRLLHPLQGMKSGIGLFDLAPGGWRDWIYRVPESNPNCEPFPVHAAWGRGVAGIVFREFDYDEERSRLVFLVADCATRAVTGPREIPLKGTLNIALAPGAEEGWLLAYLATNGAAFAARLDRDGALLCAPAVLAPGYADGRTHFHAGIQNIAVTATDRGAAVAFDGDRGLFLAVSGNGTNAWSTVRVDESRDFEYDGAVPRIAWNGQRLLVAWGDYRTEQTYLRVFDAEGRPQSASIPVADEAGVAPGISLVPLKDGYAMAWVDASITPELLRVVRIGSDGSIGPPAAFARGSKADFPIGLGMDGETARVLMCDRSNYPVRFVLKSDRLRSGGAERTK